MRYAPTTEQDEFTRTIRGFLEKRVPESERPAVPCGTERFDPTLWRDIANQLELLGIAVPEEFGGSGFGSVERGLAVEEFGRALVPAPFFATTVLVLPLLVAAARNGAATDHVRDIIAGRLVASAALAEPGRSPESAPTTQAGRSGLLSGTKSVVMDGDLADFYVVSALDPVGDTGLYLVRADAPGVNVLGQSMLDPTRGSAEVRLENAPGSPLPVSEGAGRVISDVLARARVDLAFEQLGGAQRCLEIAVDHAKNREQFGRPIGSFQAVKHMCAEVACDIESVRSAAWYAAWAADTMSDDLVSLAYTAKYLGSQAYLKAARTCVHVLGGIGYTWEHPAQLFFKRATSDAQFLGSPDEELGRLADRILDSSTVLGNRS